MKSILAKETIVIRMITMNNLSSNSSYRQKKSGYLDVLLIGFSIVCLLLYIFFFNKIVLVFDEFTIILNILFIFAMFLLWSLTSSFFYFLNKTEHEVKIFVSTISLLIVMAILSTYLISIMERIFILITSTKDKLMIIIYTAYIVPIIEEISKIFPILILFRHYIRYKNNEKLVTYRLIVSYRQFVFYSVLFGSCFGFFEHFFLFSSLFDYENIGDIAFLRIFYPLHPVTSGLLAIGIGYFLFVNSNVKKLKNWLIALPPIFLSLIFHILWNYNAYFNSLTILQYIGWAATGLFFIICISLLKKPKICGDCGIQHSEGECVKNPTFVLSLEKIVKKDTVVEKEYIVKEDYIMCPLCGVQAFDGEICHACNSWAKFQCSNCNQVVPPFARTCWSCGASLPTLQEKIRSTSPSLYMTLSVAITRIVSSTVLISLIIGLLNLKNKLSYLGFTILLLSILIALSTSLIWYRINNKKIDSIIVSIVVTSSVFFTIVSMNLLLILLSMIQLIIIHNLVFGFFGIIFSSIVLYGIYRYLRAIFKGDSLIVGGEVLG
ncbi:MAG: zinc ribbon domain-containing protein [Candidatus Heimdallarchaeum aukensis]|uniref:Zinc ribbon domain-containing protein n=1 Tax=Candidatus Heimdallarchaeum aukensis TaxID=2876573 RepID=A0A9Y1FKT4_9ARCH|nr:MAG: zinc ribbon domain-containing protein [Candidatus Heimdallarchaeum aukensis]